MRSVSNLAVLLPLPHAIRAQHAPPHPPPTPQWVAACSSQGKVPQWSDVRWTCVLPAVTDGPCGPGTDQDTIHLDAATGRWTCCAEGEILQDNACVKPQPATEGGACSLVLQDTGLSTVFQQALDGCCPQNEAAKDTIMQHFNAMLEGTVTLAGMYCDQGCARPVQDTDWWKCPKEGACEWLQLEVNEAPKTLQATGWNMATLPNPNTQRDGFVYPFDTYVKSSRNPGLEIYIKGQRVQPDESGTRFLIPAGTVGKDDSYRSADGVEVQYTGACSEDTPCVSGPVKGWTQVDLLNRNPEIDVSIYDYDIVFTLVDVLVLGEQSLVLADGKEVGKTHGAPILGSDKYNPAHITGAKFESHMTGVIHGGFWGSFRIPKGTKKVTLQNIYPPNTKATSLLSSYRINRLCKC